MPTTDEEQWACKACTFRNEATHLACSMCREPRWGGEESYGDPELIRIREERWRNMTGDDVRCQIKRIRNEITELQRRHEELEALLLEKEEKEEQQVMAASEPSFMPLQSHDSVPTRPLPSPSFTLGEEEDGKERYASGLGSLKANRRKRPREGEGTKRSRPIPAEPPEAS